MFQVQSARSSHWFDIDMKWAEENFSTRYPQFYKKLFQTNNEGQSGITYHIFTVPIGNSKEAGEIDYDIRNPLVAYHNNASNTCCFSILASVFAASG